jgi:hypothetical protein
MRQDSDASGVGDEGQEGTGPQCATPESSEEKTWFKIQIQKIFNSVKHNIKEHENQ